MIKELKNVKYYCDICGKQIQPYYLENTIIIPGTENKIGTGYAHKRCWKNKQIGEQ